MKNLNGTMKLLCKTRNTNLVELSKHLNMSQPGLTLCLQKGTVSLNKLSKISENLRINVTDIVSACEDPSTLHRLLEMGISAKTYKSEMNYTSYKQVQADLEANCFYSETLNLWFPNNLPLDIQKFLTNN